MKVVLHQGNIPQATSIRNSKIFKSQLKILELDGLNNSKINRKVNIKNNYKILLYNHQIYLKDQVVPNKKLEDSYLILIKVLIGIIKI